MKPNSKLYEIYRIVSQWKRRDDKTSGYNESSVLDDLQTLKKLKEIIDE